MKKLLIVVVCMGLALEYSLPQQGDQHEGNVTPANWQRGSTVINIDREKLTLAIDRLSKAYNIPDLAVRLVNKDSLLFSYDKNRENDGKNYLIGSCSKSFTALAIMKLVDEKYIDLDTPVKNYLPWFEMKNHGYTGSVTIRHLLNQKSGFERQYGFFDKNTDDAEAYEKNLAAYIQKLDVRFAPGTAFLYSNLNYILLGLVIQHVTGQSYADYMTHYILPVTGMTNTFFTNQDNYARNLIKAYQYSICFIPFKSSNYYYSNFQVPAGYISSNVKDIAYYLRFMLNKTVAPSGDTVLSANSFAALTGKGRTGYAMGWFRHEEDSIEIIDHSGLNENFSSSISLFPEQGLGSVILCNINSLEFCGRVDQEIRSAVLGTSYPDSRVSFEKIMRWGAFFIPLLILIGLFFNLARWRRNGSLSGFVPGIMVNLRLVVAIILSLLLLFAATRFYQMPFLRSIRFQPDIGWGLMAIAVLGIISAWLRYFGSAVESKE